ncbi:MAG TPA: PEP-CTERM sorting domain-containing protein [Terriglobales bacterium]|nr:PEP-CTERM sorting domain-containing protein [Terriglobales bacterium]
MFKRASTVIFLMCVMAVLVTPARSDVFGGVNFPGGSASFADAVVSFTPAIKNGEPIASVLDPTQALGVPNYPANPSYVSLGDGGSIVLRFTNNSLTGSGSSALDLWIFEVGPDVEDTFVDISEDGVVWHGVGKVFGATSGIDIDAFGFGLGQYFSYVRLTDDTNEGDQTGGTVGADIDAVGAISSAPPVNQVPEPASVLVVATGAVAVFLRKRK